MVIVFGVGVILIGRGMGGGDAGVAEVFLVGGGAVATAVGIMGDSRLSLIVGEALLEDAIAAVVTGSGQ